MADPPLDLEEAPREEPLPEERRTLARVGDDVVDVLHEDDVAAERGEVPEERTVPAGPEEEVPLGRPERPAVQADGERVGRVVLDRERHVEARVETPLQLGPMPLEERVEVARAPPRRR